MNFAILPAGAWGTAMAIHLRRLGHLVTLLPRTEEEALDMLAHRENRAFFPGHPLDPSLQVAVQLAPALLEAEVVILACPSRFLRPVCREIKAAAGEARRLRLLISLVKGLEEGTNLAPTEVIAQELPEWPCGALSGPTFASQVAEGSPSAIVLASNAPEDLAREVQHALGGGNLRVYTSTDLTGVELGGSLKNVYAIAAGICDGLGLRDNPKAALLTRSLAEMVRLGVALGGRVETFYGLSGFGDLILTCNGKESRNRTFGELFAQGESIESLLNVRKMTVEGYRTCDCFHRLCRERGLDAPILAEIHAILYEGKGARAALQSLMSRELKPEFRPPLNQTAATAV